MGDVSVLDDDQLALVRAVLDRIIPADDFPSVAEGDRLVEHLERLVADGDPETAAAIEATLAVCEQVDAAARRAGTPAVDAAPDTLDAVVAVLDWHERERLVQLAAEAYYGAADAPGARMIGYDARPKRGPLAPVTEPALDTTAFDAIDGAYDVVVVGAGAGGGVAACVLAEAGARVLLVERGAALSFAQVGRDHLRNHRSSVHGHNTGPPAAGNPRVHRSRSGREQLVTRPWDPRWHNNAMTVGGGTRVYQGMAWRFHPTDFAMAARYGRPDGSSLADWPITYDDLEPHYTWVEQTLGVCGDGRAHRNQGARSAGYPMPPLPPNTEAGVLGPAARRLGWTTGPVPLLLNSEPFGGRAQCVRCGECVGFACPSGAKAGSHNTVVPRALATGNCDLVVGTRAVSIGVDAGGRVERVHLVDERTGDEHTVRAGHVVVAAGAIETARLLLLSRSHAHPAGLGNEHDQVGRHLQGHSFVSAFGRFDDPVVDMDGPGVSIATLDHLHDDDSVIGGGVIANEIIKLPIVHWRWAHDPTAPRWGLAAKQAMRDSYLRTGHLFGQIQEIPRPDNRVTLADDVTDHLGLPVARLEGAAHPETLRAAEHVRARAAEWMEAAGAGRVWLDTIPEGLTAGQHQAGTCRMGDDPATSVVDPDGRVHGHENLWVADGSVHVTNGGVNPVLTILALAHRTAGAIAG